MNRQYRSIIFILLSPLKHLYDQKSDDQVGIQKDMKFLELGNM